MSERFVYLKQSNGLFCFWDALCEDIPKVNLTDKELFSVIKNNEEGISEEMIIVKVLHANESTSEDLQSYYKKYEEANGIDMLLELISLMKW